MLDRVTGKHVYWPHSLAKLLGREASLMIADDYALGIRNDGLPERHREDHVLNRTPMIVQSSPLLAALQEG
jgi:hypothetical protein